MDHSNTLDQIIEMEGGGGQGSPDCLVPNHNNENNDNNNSNNRVSSFKRRLNNNKRMKLALPIIITILIVVALVIAVYFSLKSKYKPLELQYMIVPTIIISLDGFRYDYVYRNITPNLQSLIKDESTYHANYTTPCFPSKTFPNHLSIATGLYPESHGIISNHMYDTVLNRSFHVGNPGSTDSVWYSGEPIWITAEKNNFKTACFHWAGCEVDFNGTKPTYLKQPYTHSINASEILNQIYNWSLFSSLDRPVLTMAYIHEVDDAGHKFGPDSPEVNQAIKFFDSVLGKLISQLKESGQYNSTNLIIVSDHGMAGTPLYQKLYLNQITKDENYTTKCNIVDYSPFLSIFTIKGGKTDIQIFNDLNGKHDKLKVYLKKDIPIEFHLTNIANHRIPDVMGIIELSWELLPTDKYNPPTNELGNHGFNPNYSEMKSLFIAHGPNIKNNQTLTNFSNLEIYNLLSSILNIKNPAPNNGTTLLTDFIFKY